MKRGDGPTSRQVSSDAQKSRIRTVLVHFVVGADVERGRNLLPEDFNRPISANKQLVKDARGIADTQEGRPHGRLGEVVCRELRGVRSVPWAHWHWV